MAISKYTQPIQAQYMPTTPNPQLTAMMLQKRSADEARASETRNVLESQVLGVKAYGQDHVDLLEDKQTEYQDRIGDIYDRYSNDPNATLYAMNELNRQFQKDITSGDLYDIDYRYGIAQEDIANAKERYAKGELTESAFRWQMDNAGTGYRAQKDPGMFDKVSSQIDGTNMEKSVFGYNQEQAVVNMQNSFQQQYQTQLSYMSPKERENAMGYVRSQVYSKWRADNPDGYDSDGTGTGNSDRWNIHRAGANVKQGLPPDEFVGNEAFDKDGNYEGMIPSTYDSYGGHRNVWGAAFSKDKYDPIPGVDPSEPYTDPKVVERFAKWRKSYNLPDSMTDKEVQGAVDANMEFKSASFGADYTLSDSDDIHSLIPSLSEGIGNRISTINDKEINQGEFYEKLANEFQTIDKPEEFLHGKGKAMLDNARVSLVSDGEYSGQILYEIGDVKVYTEAPSEQFELANKSSFNLKNAILNNQIGNIQGINGIEVKWTNKQYDGVDITGEWNEDSKKIEEVMYYTYDKKRLVYKDDKGKKHFVIASYDDIKSADLDNLSNIASERKRKPKYS